MDRLEGMQAFVEVIDNGGFAAAARKLGISRALVSKRIAGLEGELGARLLHRTTRQVSPTGAGSEFYRRAQTVLAEYASAVTALQAQQEEPGGLLKVSAPMSFGQLHLAGAVIDFMRDHPRIEVQLTLNDRFIDLVEEGFDVGIRIGALSDSALMQRRLAPSRRFLIAAPDYLAAHGTPAAPADLAGHACLHYGYLASGLRWRLVGPDGPHAVDIAPRLCANNGDVLLAAVLAGLGIALLPTFLCGRELQSGRAMRVLPDYAPPEAAIHAIWPSSRLLPAKVRRFIDFLAERYGNNPHWDLVD